ncbi:MAG: YdcF family protein [Gammaproteobacteria bacterium]|nr:YdcF family protein [Gammaproteobacteria bacterium]
MAIQQFSKILIVLGHANDAEGCLLPTTQLRLDGALKLFHQDRHAAIIVTGGIGARFNPTPIPHAEHMKNYLIRHGVPAHQIFTCERSLHTVDDGIYASQKVREIGNSDCKITLITSEYHIARARFIFECTLRQAFQTYGTDSLLDRSLWQLTLKHESDSLQTLKAQGGIIVEGRLIPHP